MTEGKCAIWGTPAKKEPTTGSFEIYDSCRAGGKYNIPDGVKAVLDNKYNSNNAFKAKLTTWLVNQRFLGNIVPIITEKVLREVELKNNLRNIERVERFFIYLNNSGYRLGNHIFCKNLDLEQYHFNGVRSYSFYSESEIAKIRAYTECLEDYEIWKIKDYLDASEYIKDIVDEYEDGHSCSVLTPLGLKRLDDSDLLVREDQAFVAMWFDGKMDDIYANAIQPAIEGENFKPVRIDKEHHTKNIIDFMIGEIKRSKFVVADFTSMILKDGDNRDRQVDIGGVYFEAGYALGLNIPVIWTCHKDHSGSIHFDLKQFNTIFYTDPDDLKHQLSTRIRAMFVS